MLKEGNYSIMWTVVYIAKSREIAENLRYLLEEAGILVKIRPVSKKCETECKSYDILVTETEIAKAHSIIIENGFTNFK